MKKLVAAALCLITLLSLFSCNHNNGSITDLSDNDTSDTTTTFFDEEWTLFSLAPAERGAVSTFRFEKNGTHAIVFRSWAKGGTFSWAGGVLTASWLSSMMMGGVLL